MDTTRKSVLLVVIGAVCIVFGSSAMGQEKGDLVKGLTFEQSKNDVEKKEIRPIEVPEQSCGKDCPPFSCDAIGDQSDKGKEVHAACLNALEENFIYESERLRHRKWVFRFQLIATNISFVVVMVMIGFGLRFAYIQFSREFPKVPSATTLVDSPATAQANVGSRTDIELSLARIKISSSILGVIILGLAMGFFYLYLRFVFPVQGVQ